MRNGLVAAIALSLASSSTALAFAPHAAHVTDTGAPRPAVELYDPAAPSPRSGAARGDLRWDAPPRALRAPLARFELAFGPGWRASFDDLRGAPSRLYGPGLPVDGAVADPAVAEAHARAILAAHVDLLAPGSMATDFELVSNDLDAGIRSVGFVQRRGSLRVLGGQVSFRYKNDRLYVIGTEALAHVPDLSGGGDAGAESSEAAALSWITEDFGPASAAPAGPLVVIATPDGRGHLRFARAREVDVTTHDVVGQYRVAVDAATARPIARRSLLHFAEAPVLLRVPERAPTFGARADYPALFATVNVEGASDTTGNTGVVTWTTGATTDVELFLEGSRVKVMNDVGAEALLETTLSDGVPFVWDESTTPTVDAQLNAFIHAERVRTYAKTFAPTLGFLNTAVQATVNIDDTCNAFSNGTTINFYRAGGGCENTGRIADVIYHEYGHSIHNHAIVPGVGSFEGALSEGISDYLAATITGDPGTARGFELDSSPLRHIDPSNGEAVFPDDLVGEVHYDGLIIAGALWDLRKALVLSLGEAEGVATANQLFYQGIRRAVDMPSMYVEILAADDDDGDLTNGTPNVCEINESFGRHGMRPPLTTTAPTLGVASIALEGYDVSVALAGLFPQCEGEDLGAGTLTWRDRAGGPTESIAMTQEGNVFFASIPQAAANTVLKYAVEIEVGDGTASFPNNAADPEYELFVGTPITLYCTDFESDPEDEGWTHGLLDGDDDEGADDWAWDEPKGDAANGDPPLAYSGEKAYGNDLSIQSQYDGLYQANKVNFTSTPVIDTQGHTNVHLQYRRWLNVEDAFFDRASIRVGDAVVWQNLDSDDGDASNTHHRDREWRFHDVDLSEHVAGGSVQVTFELASDGGLQFGGWTLDDVCVVALEGAPVDPCETGTGGGCEGTGGSGGGSDTGGAPADGADDDDGCDCSTPRGHGGKAAFLGASALALLVSLRRRRAAR